MVTITLMGQLQTADGERDLAFDISGPTTVKQLIQRQGEPLHEIRQLLQEKRLLVTVNKRIASEDTRVQDGDTIKLVPHDGMGKSGLAPA